jgi:hypothetical protein
MNIVDVDIKAAGLETVNLGLFGPRQGVMVISCEYSNGSSGSIKAWNF